MSGEVGKSGIPLAMTIGDKVTVTSSGNDL